MPYIYTYIHTHQYRGVDAYCVCNIDSNEVCMYALIIICICVGPLWYLCMSLCIYSVFHTRYLCMCACIYAYFCASAVIECGMCVCICVCMYVCILQPLWFKQGLHVCMYACMHVCIFQYWHSNVIWCVCMYMVLVHFKGGLCTWLCTVHVLMCMLAWMRTYTQYMRIHPVYANIYAYTYTQEPCRLGQDSVCVCICICVCVCIVCVYIYIYI
jgi:hypothetical protein